MQLPEDFWAFRFELINFHLFQQCQPHTTMTSLWRNVVANSNWSLLISDPKVHWRVQPTAARRSSIFNFMHGRPFALQVSLNNAFTRIVRNPQLEKEQWPPNNSPNLNGMEISCHVWRATHEAILKPLAQNSVRIKNSTGRDMGHFSSGPLNKAVRSFTSSLTRTVREDILSYSKKFALNGICADLNSWDNFL